MLEDPWMDERHLRKNIYSEARHLPRTKGKSTVDQSAPNQTKIIDVPLEIRKRDAVQPWYLERYE